MKIYRDGDEVRKIKRCGECPNCQPDYIFTFAGPKECFTCKAVELVSRIKGYDGKPIRYNPEVSKSWISGCCPLEDDKSGAAASAHTSGDNV